MNPFLGLVLLPLVWAAQGPTYDDLSTMVSNQTASDCPGSDSEFPVCGQGTTWDDGDGACRVVCPTGTEGPQGPAGPQGPEGPQGPKGNTGSAGPSGPLGITGPAGPAGPKGNTGSAGSSGPAGPQGAGITIKGLCRATWDRKYVPQTESNRDPPSNDKHLCECPPGTKFMTLISASGVCSVIVGTTIIIAGSTTNLVVDENGYFSTSSGTLPSNSFNYNQENAVVWKGEASKALTSDIVAVGCVWLCMG